MTACTYSSLLPWSLSDEAERRFQRILRANLAVILLLGIVVPYLPLTEIVKPVREDLPPRLVKLLLDIKPTPPPPEPVTVINRPKPIQQPLKKTRPAPKPVPKTASRKSDKPAPVRKPVSARQQAEQAGLLALKDTLRDLRQKSTATSLKQTGTLSRGGGHTSKTERAILTAGTTRGSNGINTASLSRNTGGGALESRATTQVRSPVSGASGGSTVADGGNGKGERRAGRSIEEIQMVFDRNKGAIYSVYNRALRKDPTLQGKVVLRLTIAPSGKVTLCELVSSELHDPVLGQKISQRVKLFDFGAKDVSEVTLTYPIDFLPA